MLRSATGWLVFMLLLCTAATALGQDEPGGDELPQGYWHVNIARGYDEFALPIANGALGREWALGTTVQGIRAPSAGNYAWQIGRNYSVVPIRIDILHRQPRAFRGRVEITWAHAFAPAEDALGDLAVLSQEVLVPPSKLCSYMLLPRVCPPSEPGGTVRFELKIFEHAKADPSWADEVYVWQLEPAYLYSLHLDGPENLIPVVDELNPGNELELAIEPGGVDPAGVLSSKHYLLNVDRRQVTLAPLACRDFAFVICDLTDVVNWPLDEQSALRQFLLAGGYLCLYNTAGQDNWGKLSLADPQPVGRGWLVPVAGGLASARDELRQWLEGELTEFCLWAGGSAGELSLRNTPLDRQLLADDRLNIAEMFEQDSEAANHAAGYLNPIWIYRETRSCGTLEPWDYPEFSQDYGVPSDSAAPGSLLEVMQRQRRIPAWYYWLALLLPISLVGFLFPGRLKLLKPAPLLAVLVLGGYQLFGTEEWHQPAMQLELVDADLQLDEQTYRLLQVALPGQDREQSFALPEDALLRAVYWDNPQGWSVANTLDSSIWRGRGGGPIAALNLAGASGSPVELPVAIRRTGAAGASQRIRIDASGLHSDRTCLLLTPLGWWQIQPDAAPLEFELDWPQIPVRPGPDRIRALLQATQRWRLDFASRPGPTNELAMILATEAETGELGETLSPTAAALAWQALLRNPGGFRSLLQSQAVLFVPLGEDSSSELVSLKFLRVTFPLNRLEAKEQAAGTGGQ